MRSITAAPASHPLPSWWRTPSFRGASAVACILALLLVIAQQRNENGPAAPQTAPTLSLSADPMPLLHRAGADWVDPLELELVYLEHDLRRAAEALPGVNLLFSPD